MKKTVSLTLLTAFAAIVWMGDSCDPQPSSDMIQRQQQEKLLLDGTAQTGMPAIKNFRERKLLKDILEQRDNEVLSTYTYIVAENTGKLIFLGNSVGYGIPYATEYTNPNKTVEGHGQGEFTAIAQADPNGLFAPASADGTWVMMLNPQTRKAVPVYIEPRVIISPFPLPTN